MNKGHNEYIAVLVAIILAAVLASGCSTPAQTGNAYQHETQPVSYPVPAGATAASTASQSYYQCMNVLTQYGYQQQCYQVSNPYATSYTQYTYAKTGFAKVTDEQKAAAYADYLSSLDDAAAADMKAQYDALIAQYSK